VILVDSDVLIEHLRGKTPAREWLVQARQSSGPLARCTDRTVVPSNDHRLEARGHEH
jgi:predicted nucleic acid-binding protein